MNPKVTIIVPLHNKENYIKETIDSVLAQSFDDWEMIVVENGSTDDGVDVVRKFSDPRIRLIESNKRGPSSARNMGLSQSSGEWIQFLDADDLLLDGHFENQIQTINKNPGCQLVTCDWKEGKELLGEDAIILNPARCDSPDCRHGSAIAFTPWVVHSAWVKRTVLGDNVWWNESFDQLSVEDHVFWFKILLETKPVYSPHLGVFYRTSTTNRRHNLSDTTSYIENVNCSIQANIEMLKQKNMNLEYAHRRSLFNLYLNLISESLKVRSPKLILSCTKNLREYSPEFLSALKKRDVAVILSYLMKPSWFVKLKSYYIKKN